MMTRCTRSSLELISSACLRETFYTWFYTRSIILLVTHSLTHSWSWALLEKLSIVQLLKNFPAFYGIRRFLTMLTGALHWSLSCARLIQSTPSHPISLRSILILSTHLHLGLPSGRVPSGIPINILYTISDTKNKLMSIVSVSLRYLHQQ
jgi:hypothetical protein